MEDSAPDRLHALRLQILDEALADVIAGGCGAAQGAGCDADNLEVLRQAAQVSSALQQLQLGSASSSLLRAGRPGCPAAAGHQAATAAAAGEDDDGNDDAAGAVLFAGASGTLLGVLEDDLLSVGLPSESRRHAALAAAAPALEAELRRRCRLVAAASGYAADDYKCLADHIRQLQGSRDKAAQVQAWAKAAQQAQQALHLLQRACAMLAGLAREHKLGGQREADEAQAAFLRCECSWLAEKIKLVQLQLQKATYTPAVVPVLRRIAGEVDSKLGGTAAELKQASMQLQQYRALGAQYEQLAREHRMVLQQLEEAEYELRELDQFSQLQKVTG